MNFGNLCHFDVVLVVVYEIYYKWWLLPSSSHGESCECVYPRIQSMHHFGFNLIYEFSKSVCLFVCRGLETQITFNKIVPPNSKAQKLFRTSSSYFLLLLLRPFSRSNCRRSLLLTFTFMSVSAQQLPSSMGEVFLGFGGWVRRFGCVFFGLKV